MPTKVAIVETIVAILFLSFRYKSCRIAEGTYFLAAVGRVCDTFVVRRQPYIAILYHKSISITRKAFPRVLVNVDANTIVPANPLNAIQISPSPRVDAGTIAKVAFFAAFASVAQLALPPVI